MAWSNDVKYFAFNDPLFPYVSQQDKTMKVFALSLFSLMFMGCLFSCSSSNTTRWSISS